MGRKLFRTWTIAALTVLGLSAAAHAAAAGFRIEEEPAAAASAQPGAPVIEVEAAAADATAEPGAPIRLVFKAAPDAHIVLGSFKVLYGFWRIDITSAILRHARPAAGGLVLEDAQIPRGEHKLLLQVRDDKDRQGEMRVSLVVQ